MWEELRNAREGKAMTQYALGDKTMISPGCISTWEKEMPEPFERLKRLCKELSISPNHILGWSVDESEAKPGELEEGSILVSKNANLSKEDLISIRAILEKRDAEMRSKLLEGQISLEAVEEVNEQYALIEKISESLGGAKSDDK